MIIIMMIKIMIMMMMIAIITTTTTTIIKLTFYYQKMKYNALNPTMIMIIMIVIMIMTMIIIMIIINEIKRCGVTFETKVQIKDRYMLFRMSVFSNCKRSNMIRLIMMTSSNGNIFRVTGPLCGEFTGPGEFPTQRPVTRSFNVFFDLRFIKPLSKQWWGWWFETLLWSLWRRCNV